MLRLNIRQSITQIGMRTQLSTLSPRMIKPEAHTEYVAPRSNKGTTQGELQIDSYPSRHSYGFTNHEDFAKQYGQQGKSDLTAAIKRHNSEAWAMINNGARPGTNQVKQQALGRLDAEINKKRYIVAQAIPDPQISYTPSQVVGETDPGKYDWSVQTDYKADVQFNRGSVETYIRQKGEVRQWVTEDRYDIYA